jgi:hypothetical protein
MHIEEISALLLSLEVINEMSAFGAGIFCIFLPFQEVNVDREKKGLNSFCHPCHLYSIVEVLLYENIIIAHDPFVVLSGHFRNRAYIK